MERYIYSGTKKLRCGYTTGSCATAVAKASAEMLLSGKKVSTVKFVTPSGVPLVIGVSDCSFDGNCATCSALKDGGDDPDVTNGIKIFGEVSKIPCGIEITGGKGVGIVTKDGLDQPKGAYAINSVPRKMIAEALSETAELYDYKGGFRVVISVPDGERVAGKTFNSRLGIVGGISIIGTTGIVEPMSSSAMIATMRTEANIQRKAGIENLLLNLGNYSEKFIRLKSGRLSERTVTCSNFIGEGIDIGVSLGFKGILIIGHIGKMVKLGSGIMNTHSSYADGRIETFIACGAIAGVEGSVLRKLADCATADSVLDILYENNVAEQTLQVLAERSDSYLRARVKGEAEIGAVIFSDKHSLVLKTASADELIRRIEEE